MSAYSSSLVSEAEINKRIFDSFLDALLEVTERDLDSGKHIFQWLFRETGLEGGKTRSPREKIDSLSRLPPILRTLVRGHLSRLVAEFQRKRVGVRPAEVRLPPQ